MIQGLHFKKSSYGKEEAGFKMHVNEVDLTR